MDLLSVAVAALFLISATLLIFSRMRVKKLPPGPRPWPAVGNLYDIKPVRFRCFAEWAETYGPIMSVWFGTTLNVVVSSSELAREVLKEKDQALADRPRNRSTARFSRDGKDLIWADYGPHYVKMRKLCNLELFSPKRLEALRHIREEEVATMVASISRDCTSPDKLGQSLELRNYLSAVSFNNITRLVFGKRFMDSEGVMDELGREFKAIVSQGVKVGGTLSIAEYVRWLRWMCPLDEEAFLKFNDRRDRLTKRIMDEYTCARGDDKECGSSRQHFVGALLALREEYDLSDDNVIGLLWDMITAGTDTTVITAEWAMAELVRNPRVQEKAQEELDRVIGFNKRLTEADFPNLPYLHCVVKEAFRLHPPTPLMLPHRASTDTKIGGYDIPRGSNVQINVWAIARDPNVWNSPLEFRPERFEEEIIDIKGNDFRVLPFGSGRRVCPGAHLGINLLQSMLGHLLHHFKWELKQGMRPEEVDMTENPGIVTFMHTPLQVVAIPRFPSNLPSSV